LISRPIDILISKEEINARINLIAAEINQHYKDQNQFCRSVYYVVLLFFWQTWQLADPAALYFMTISSMAALK
jgi:hypoxanthine-guanine phosphoribosyltransferase